MHFFHNGPVISGEAIAMTIGHSNMLIDMSSSVKKMRKALDCEVEILISAVVNIGSDSNVGPQDMCASPRTGHV